MVYRALWKNYNTDKDEQQPTLKVKHSNRINSSITKIPFKYSCSNDIITMRQLHGLKGIHYVLYSENLHIILQLFSCLGNKV